jgi:hypothetical protein
MNIEIDLITSSGGMIIEARGRFGGRVYYMKNGRACTRKHVVPANPRTRFQQHGRSRFARAVRGWRTLDDRQRDKWNARARHLNMSGYNLFISRCMGKAKVRRMYRSGMVPKKRPHRAAALQLPYIRPGRTLTRADARSPAVRKFFSRTSPGQK